MNIINITKEGVKVSDLGGRVVTVKEATPVYELIQRMNTRRKGVRSDHDTNAQARKS